MSIRQLTWRNPEAGDQYDVKELATNVFKIKYQGAKMTVKMTEPEQGKTDPNVELIDFPESYDMKFEKLLGYVVVNLVPKYKKQAPIIVKGKEMLFKPNNFYCETGACTAWCGHCFEK